ncbi:MAG: hypothetical protein KF687_10290 [Cyclobacteriaceae bacterium]|nr:hypothetical protein [Cyclobacteriaceae bacterium]
MPNLSDKELDNLFKTAAEQSEGDAALPEWSDMTKRLDEAKRADTLIAVRSAVTGSVLLLVVTTMIWMGVSTDNENNVINNITTDPTGSTGNSVYSQQAKEATNNPLQAASSSIQSTVAASSLNASKPVHHVVSPGSKDIQGSSSLVVGDQPASESSAWEATRSDESHPEVHIDQHELNDSVLVEAVENESLKETTEHGSEKKPKEVRANQRSLSIKLTISPDYSTVESSKPGQLGINYGILFEYPLGKHISIAGGLIRAKKIYSAVDVEYNGYPSDRVTGDCRMWDIPLIVYYNFSPGKTWSVYSGIGISSYLMSQENYVYYVDGSYGNTYTYYQSVEGKNNEWFSILNLSIGFEKKLNDRFAFQLEPFYKAPLASVGEGDVSLASFGAFLNLKYSFLKETSK